MQVMIIVAILAAMGRVAFALQNNVPVTVTFLVWRFDSSLAMVLLMALALGARRVLHPIGEHGTLGEVLAHPQLLALRASGAAGLRHRQHRRPARHRSAGRPAADGVDHVHVGGRCLRLGAA